MPVSLLCKYFIIINVHNQNCLLNLFVMFNYIGAIGKIKKETVLPQINAVDLMEAFIQSIEWLF